VGGDVVSAVVVVELCGFGSWGEVAVGSISFTIVGLFVF
jgi:hypothetical protein